MIMEIGIGLIAFGIGLFMGQKLGTRKDVSDSKQPSWITRIKEKQKEKQEEKKLRAEIQRQAREEALRDMKPELVKHMKQEEMKKLTGEDRKEKMEKLKNAFSMGGSGFNTEQKLNNMMGGRMQQQQFPQNYQQPQQNYQQSPQRQFNFTKQQPNNNQNNNMNMNLGNTFSNEKISKMLGKDITSKQEMSAEEKIRRMLR